MVKKKVKITPYLTAEQRMMMWRKKRIDEGFKTEEYEQFEKDVFNSYISKDVAETLHKSKEVQEKIIDVSNQINKDSRQALRYFLLTAIVAIGSMLLSIALQLSS